MDFSKFFVFFALCQTKLKFDQDFNACGSFCFELKVLIQCLESDVPFAMFISSSQHCTTKKSLRSLVNHFRQPCTKSNLVIDIVTVVNSLFSPPILTCLILTK